MKKLTLLLLIVLTSCSKQDNDTETEIDGNLNYYDKAYIEKAPLNEQLEYKRFHLKKIANWLSKNNGDVYDILSKELSVNNKMDRFFVGNIIEDITSKNSQKSWDLDEIKFSLTAFENLDGEDAYPTIFLPDTKKFFNRTPYDSIKPLYALDDYDEINQEQIMVGYQENVNNELQPIDEPLVPGIAEESEIIVLSIAPCTDPIGGTNSRVVGCGNSGGGGGSQSYERYYIRQMTIKENKEPWPARSDISLVGFKTLGLPYESGSCGNNIAGASDCLNEPEGRYMKEFNRSWISDEDEQTLDHLIDMNINPNNVDMYFALVIFERDNWPADERVETFSFPNGVSRTTKYRSWDTKYHKVLVKNNSANQGVPKIDGYLENNSEIKYNISH